MRFKIFPAISVVILTLLSAVAFATDGPKPDNLSVEWQQKRLSLVAENAPLPQIMLAIANKTGMEVHGLEFLIGTAKVKFSKLPLALALKALLPNASYLLQEPTGSKDNHPVLSVLSYNPGNPAQTTTDNSSDTSANSTKVPATAGYVPVQYRNLYAYAEKGNIQALKQAIKKGEPTSQFIATQLLAQKNPGMASELAAETAKSADPNRRLNAIQALSELDNNRSTKALGAALQDPDLGVRNAAVLGLHNQTSTNAVALLAGALQDEDASIRILALDLLAEKGTEGVAGINEALASNDPQLREHAQELLQQIIPSD